MDKMVGKGKIALCFSLTTLFIINLCLISCKDNTNISIRLEKKFSLCGDEEIPFYEPSGIVVDDDGNIYVADSGNQRVVKFNSKGEFVKSFGTKGQGPGEFQFPWQLAIYDNEIYVYDWNKNIQKFTLDGGYISGFNLRGGIFLDFAIDTKGKFSDICSH